MKKNWFGVDEEGINSATHEQLKFVAHQMYRKLSKLEEDRLYYMNISKQCMIKAGEFEDLEEENTRLQNLGVELELKVMTLERRLERSNSIIEVLKIYQNTPSHS